MSPMSSQQLSTGEQPVQARRCRCHSLISSYASFTLFASVMFFLREFLTIVSFAFGILFAFLYLMRDASTAWLASCDISNPELLVLVMTITTLVLSLFAGVAVAVRVWARIQQGQCEDEESKPALAEHQAASARAFTTVEKA